MRRLNIGALALAAWAGASAWISLGTIAVVNQDQARIAALPPLWLLLTLVLGAVAAAWAARLPTSEAWPLSVSTLVWLPWLPASVPAAFLVPEGPLEGAIWLAALGGVLAARLSTKGVELPSWTHDPRRAPLCAAAMFFGCSIGAGAALQGLLPGGDEPHYLVITQSLLEDGDLEIENNHESGDYLAYVPTPIRPDFLQRGKDGQIYSVHAPGVSALVLPAYGIAGYAGALVLVSLVTALAVALMWRASYELTERADAAWIATIVVGLGAPLFLHSFTIFPDPVGAGAVAVALLVLVRLQASPQSVKSAHLIIAGSALAGLPWLHTRFAVVSAMFGIVFALRVLTSRDGGLRVRRSWLAFGVIPALSAAAWFAFFWAIYGTPNPSAPYGDSRQNALAWIPAGLAGLIFDQQFGIIASTPALALLPLGVWALWKTHRRLAIELVVIALPYILVVASFGMWWGGWSAPGRLMTCLMPLGAVAIAAAWVQSGSAARHALVALAVVGLVNVGVRVTYDGGKLLYNYRDGFDLLLDRASRTVDLPLAFPSIHRLGTEPTVLLGAIWIVAGGVALVSLAFLFAGRSLGMGVRWALTTWVLIGCAGGAMTASWRAARTQPLTPESSEIEFLHRWRPARRPLNVRLPEWHSVASEAALHDVELRGSERARDLGQHRPLLSLARVPAGDYQLVIDGGPDLDGRLSVSIGATSQSTEEWQLQGIKSGPTDLWLHTPVPVHSLAVRGDARAEQVISRVALRPQRLRTDDEEEAYALRAARYGRVRAFFLDDAIYMEPNGTWTRGDSTGAVVIAADSGDVVDVDLTAGPVPAIVTFSVNDAERQEISLAAGERRRVQWPVGKWTIVTSGRFRPKDHDRNSPDARSLGVRLDFR